MSRANGNAMDTKTVLQSEKNVKDNTSLHWLLLSAVVAVGAIAVANNIILRSLKDSTENLFNELASSSDSDASADSSSRPRVWIAGKRLETGYLRHVMEAFDKLGYLMVNGTEEDWDILWSHEYPFSDSVLKYQLQPHQRVNHFPGSGYITNKVSLATSDIKYVPKAFHLPKSKDEFVKFAKENPQKLWVKKSNDHRGIRIEKADEMDLDASGTFVQEYIHNPLLIDGKKFDIGVYVIMTSVEPLRVYILHSDALLRFCARPYLPFNATDLDSYVVGDDYTPIWEMPSLKRLFDDAHLNMKETLNTYLRSINKDPVKMWHNIEDAIASVYLAKERQIAKLTQVVANSRHFFEMVRFDFVVDENLNIYIMEANMSPNLSSLHFKPNKRLYEQVVYNVLSVAGIANTLHVQNWMSRNEDFWNLMVNDKDLSVYDDICSSSDCHKSCSQDQCQLCTFCLSEEVKDILKDAAIEHKSRWNTKRIIPTETRAGAGLYDAIQQKWFQGKCQHDASWCP